MAASTHVPAWTTRWGLLLTTLLLGAALVATGITNYLDARRAAISTARVEANDLLQLRHDLRDAGAVSTATLERLLEESRPRGVRYIAVVTRDGVLGAAGTPGGEVTWQAPGPEERTRAPQPRDRRPSANPPPPTVPQGQVTGTSGTLASPPPQEPSSLRPPPPRPDADTAGPPPRRDDDRRPPPGDQRPPRPDGPPPPGAPPRPDRAGGNPPQGVERGPERDSGRPPRREPPPNRDAEGRPPRPGDARPPGADALPPASTQAPSQRRDPDRPPRDEGAAFSGAPGQRSSAPVAPERSTDGASRSTDAPLEEPPPDAAGHPNPPTPAPPLQLLPGTSIYRAIAWLEPPPDPRRALTPADRSGPLAPVDAIMVVDFEPVIATRMVSRALVALIAQVATTCVLGAAAVSFWRNSRREETARQEAERDRHLRTLGEMSAVLGHELRNPLTSLKGHAQLLLERLPADHPGHTAAGTIVAETMRLEALANQVLEFVKTGSLDFQSVDPRELASEAADLSGVEHVVTAFERLPATWPLDRARLVAVLVNLLKNARDASPPDTPIELRVAVDRGRLVYEVLDRGEGLPTGEESRAFEPFFTTRVHGTGLGLALAKRVVDGHGGTISAANRPGGGASFRIALPRQPLPRTA